MFLTAETQLLQKRSVIFMSLTRPISEILPLDFGAYMTENHLEQSSNRHLQLL